jgi:cell division protein ZipA
MEFGLREYLLILGAMLIVGLLVDGVRRTLKHKREGLNLDLMAAPPESPERSDVSKPRAVKKATPEELEPQVNADPLFESSDASQLNLWAGEIKVEAMKSADQDALAEDRLPDTRTNSLFEGYEPANQSSDRRPVEESESVTAGRVEPLWNEEVAALAETPIEVDVLEPQDDTSESDHEDDMRILTDGPLERPMKSSIEGGILGSTLGRIFGLFGKQDSDLSPADAILDEPIESADANHGSTVELSQDSGVEESMDDLIVVRIQSARTSRFDGINLHKACLRAGLRRGESLMYQRFPLDEGVQPLFSLVNGIEPGTFDEDAKSIDTPVVFLFTELPKQTDPVFAVNELISGARSIARDIGGDVYDQNGVAISKEWIDLARAQAGHHHLLRS